MGSPWVFDPDAWSNIKQYLGLGGFSSSSGSESYLLPEAKKQKFFNLKQISDHVYEILKEAISPSSKKPGVPSAEIIFFHGLQLGNSSHPHITTWLSRDGMDLWLNWLLEDFQDVRIFTISYDAFPEKREDRGRLDMYCTCENLMGELMRNRKSGADERRCPIILVGHCLGGLVLKEVCVAIARRKGIEKKDERWKYSNFLEDVKGIFCYASPHHGSQLPDCSKGYPRGSLFERFKPLDAATARGNEDFRMLRNRQEWKSQGVGESREVTLGDFTGLIVPEASSKCDVDNYYTADADHFNACRPESKISTAYSMLKELIDHVIKESWGISKKNQGRSVDHQSMLGFQQDPRYVRLQVTEKRVREALAKPGEPRVVLLHGGPGRGKSTLAQDLALQVESGKEHLSNSSHKTHNDSQVDGEEESNVSDLYRAFDGVVYLKCGPEVQLLALQSELRKNLGWDELEHHNERVFKEVDSGFELQKSLRNLLQNQKVLIIFDDVRDVNILQTMISLCGKNVKCLVTSQDAKLCNRVNCGSLKCIPMEIVNLTSAKKILASHILGVHVNMKDRQIPEYIEELADMLIERVDRNLLAIACLATAVDSQSFTEEHLWEEVVQTWFDYLEEESTAFIHGFRHVHGSYLVAMNKCFQSLISGAKKLLILVSLCRGPSVPEEVIQYLYKLLKPEGLSGNFLKAKGQLEGKQLIQFERVHIDHTSWSIHSLLKEYIVHSCETEELDVLETLRKSSRKWSDGGHQIRDSEGEENIKMVLLGLYLHHLEFSEKLMLQMDITKDDLNTLHGRRYVVEPLIRLLVSKNVTIDTNLQYALQRVVLHYVQRAQIREDDAIVLLKAPKYCLSMVLVLQQFAENSSTTDTPVGEDVMLSLLELLGNKESRYQKGLVASISETFFRLHVKGHARPVDPENAVSSRALEELTDALRNDNDPELQLAFLSGLFRIVVDGGIAERLCDTPDTLGEIVKCLFRYDRPKFQNAAAIALGCLANYCGQKVSCVIRRSPTLLEGLSKLLTGVDNPLSQTNNPELQQHATSALAILAEEGGCEVVEAIASFPGALQALVDALPKLACPHLQALSASALEILARKGGQWVTLKISNTDGALANLVDSLTKEHNHQLQKQAAWALGSLAKEGGYELSKRICNTSGLLHNLVSSLSKDDNPGLQERATSTLATLADQGCLAVIEEISNVPGALQALVNALARLTSPHLQARSAQSLEILARKGGNTVALKISNMDGALGNLSDSLTKDHNPELQKQAAWALGSLADEGGHEVSEKICNASGLVDNLVSSLSKDDNPGLQEQATSTLATLAQKGGPSVREDIKHVSTACEALTKVVVMAEKNIDSGYISRSGCFAMRALSLIDPMQGRELPLKSASAYIERGYGELILGLHKEALNDFDEAWRTQALDGDNNVKAQIMSNRGIAKARLGNLQGALEDWDSCVTFIRSSFYLQERGIVKRMMRDLPGALMDLDEALRLGPDDYEVLKHRGYVKFLMQDENGADADAKRALEVKPPRVDFGQYGHLCLGTSSVEYLDFKLR